MLVDGERVFSELHVISDLHLGGAPGSQIFAGTAELCGLIDRLRGQSVERHIALVINGDFLDFLAERPGMHFDPTGAIGKIDRIRADAAFEPIWKALRAYVAQANRWLVIVLGNHDVELALPRVMNHLIETFAEGNDSARGRIVVSMGGHGFAARVGGKRVVCVHGNEADTWNVIDFDRLRRITTAMELGVPQGDAWIPNAGTMLVINVMNQIKNQFPFVDLLKPETKGVIPVLWALDQGTASLLSSCIGVAGKLAWDKARRSVGLLSAEVTSSNERVPDEQALRDLLETGDTRSSGMAADAMVEAAMRHVNQGTDPVAIAGGGQLGLPSAIWNRVINKSPEAVAFEAMQRLAKDQSFRRSEEDKTFERVDTLVGEADFVIAGHTHLEKDLARRRTHGRYFNTGTWARLIRIRPEWLASSDRFRPVWNALRSTSLAALDAIEIEKQPLVSRRHTVASITEHNGDLKAVLNRVHLVGKAVDIREPTVAEE